MDLLTFLNLVEEMRQRQLSPSRFDQHIQRVLESKVDDAIKELRAGPTLFDKGGEDYR